MKLERDIVVISPGFNCSQYIELWYNSLRVQNFSNWTCYAIDDCSTDDTYEKLVKISEKDNRIIPIKTESKCYQIGNWYETVRDYTKLGDFVVILDLDDWFGSKYVFENMLKEYFYRDSLVFTSRIMQLSDYYNHDGKTYVDREELLSTHIHEYSLLAFPAEFLMNIPESHFMYNGEYIPVNGDTLITYPILYQAGCRYHKHLFIDNCVVYNNIRPINDDNKIDETGRKLHDKFMPIALDRFRKLVDNEIIKPYMQYDAVIDSSK